MTTYAELPSNTRVWIYQSNRPLSNDEVSTIKRQLSPFTQQWVSHDRQLKAWGDVLHNRFILLMVDESQADASGCSIDKSVAFIKKVEQQFEIDLFDRWNFAYKEGEEVKSAHRDQFATLYKEGKINDQTIVFDNQVTTKAAFEQKWEIPLNQSWHKRLI